MATEDAQLDWMYDYIVQFLKSPGWRTPIMIFIDENCGLFDNEEENKLEYSEIHTKFKDMIDVLFENLVGELNVHIEEFAKALELGRKTPVHRRIFEQVSACDNFLSFKKLMCKRNREIEEEALRLMQQEEGATDFGGDEQARREQAELEHAMAISLEMENERLRATTTEDDELKRAIEESEKEFKSHQEKLKTEEEALQQEEVKRQEEEKKLKEEAEERVRQEEIRVKREEEERVRQEEIKKEKEEEEKKQEEIRVQKEKEEQERIVKLEEEKKFQEAESAKVEAEAKAKKEEEKREQIRIEEEKKQKEEEEVKRVEEEKRVKEEEEVKAMVAEQEKIAEEKRKVLEEKKKVFEERKKAEDEKIAELKKIREMEATRTEEEIKAAQMSTWTEEEKKAGKRATDTLGEAPQSMALPPVMLKKKPDVPISMQELNRGKMSTDTEMNEQERLAAAAAAIIKQNEGMAAFASVAEAPKGKESLNARQLRLKQQRDMLLAKKKAEREKELADYAERGGIGATAAVAANEKQEESKDLAKRMKLAEKIKASMAAASD